VLRFLAAPSVSAQLSPKNSEIAKKPSSVSRWMAGEPMSLTTKA
jgi:hypothetical protein